MDILEEYLKTEENKEVRKIKEEICKNLFNFVKQKIAEGTFEDIRLKYLGVLTVYQGTVKGQLNKAKKQLLSERITKEEYDKIETLTIKFLENYEMETKNK